MDNLKHIKTKYSKNDTSMTLLSIMTVFVFPISVFSFCYLTQNNSCVYTIKSESVLERDLNVVSIQSHASTQLAMIEKK